MSKLRIHHGLSLLLALTSTFFCASLLWIALSSTIPAKAAPHSVLDETIAIISVTHLDLHANDIISDPFRNVLYATLPSSAGPNGNRIVPIQVPTGTLGTPLFVGSEPNHMALSNDGQYLYVGIDGANAVRRVNLISYTAEIQIPLGASGFCGALTAADIVVLQDNPHAIAVAKSGANCENNAGVSIFDDETKRPDSTAEFGGISVIEPSSSPTLLYGYYASSSSIDLQALVISPTGVAITVTPMNFFNGYSEDILFHEGLLYANNGAVIEPESETALGSYAGHGSLAPDSTESVVYMVGIDGYYYEPLKIKLFHQTEYTLIKTLPLTTIPTDYFSNAKRLLLTGPQQLVMLTNSGDLYLIKLGKLIPAAPFFETEPIVTAVEEANYSYVITAADPNYGDVLAISAPVLPSWLTLSSWGVSVANLSGNPYYNNLGDNVVELLVTDSQGLTNTQRFTIPVTANPFYIPPAFTSTPSLVATKGISYTYHVATRDENTYEGLTISAPILPGWLELSDINTIANGTARLHGIPAQGNVGEQFVKLMVTDGHGLTETQKFTLTVADVLPFAAPSFDSTPPLAATEAITYRYLVTASDADVDDVLTISAPLLPSWLNLTPLANGAAELSGIPTAADAGAHPVSLLVTDTHGLLDLQQFTVTVTSLADDLPPAFGSTPILGAAEGITYTYIVTASDPQVGDLLTFSAPTLPGCLTLSPLLNGAARLSGVAANGDIGEHAVALMVTDSDGLTDTQHFTLTVVGVGQVQGVLFEDSNGNDTQDEGEAGIAGATVSLTPAAGSITAMAIPQTAITTTTTVTGSYQFANVPTGNYTVSFDLPGEQTNPPAQPITVTTNIPTVILPVAVVKEPARIYLPNVKTPKDANARR